MADDESRHGVDNTGRLSRVLGASCGSGVNCSLVDAYLQTFLSPTATVSVSNNAQSGSTLGTHTLIVTILEKVQIGQGSTRLPTFRRGDLTVVAPSQSSAAPSDNGAGSTTVALNTVQGDNGSDVDTYSANWLASNESDYYTFHLKRTLPGLAPPPLRAVITISGLQSGADFDITMSNADGPGTYGSVTHTGATPADGLCFQW
jgi:hypothetical protein